MESDTATLNVLDRKAHFARKPNPYGPLCNSRVTKSSGCSASTGCISRLRSEDRGDSPTQALSSISREVLSMIFWGIFTILLVGLFIIWDFGLARKFINWFWDVHQCSVCGRYFRGRCYTDLEQIYCSKCCK